MSLLGKTWSALAGKAEEESAPASAHASCYADVTVILDRSASMASMQQAVVEGFNAYVKSMRETPGNNKWSLVQFDDHSSAAGAGEAFPQPTYLQHSESQVPYLAPPPTSLGKHQWNYGVSGFAVCYETPKEPAPTGQVYFLPRGGTALVDAMYSTVESIDCRLSGQDNVKPVVMVITDGEENSSRLHSSEELRALVARTQAKGFEYIYLGANQDSFHQANKYGIADNLRHYTVTPVLSGGLDGATASCTNNFTASYEGMHHAIMSGMVAVACIASGAVASGCINYYRGGM